MASHFLVIKKKQQKKRQPDESGFKQHKSVKKRDKIKKISLRLSTEVGEV